MNAGAVAPDSEITLVGRASRSVIMMVGLLIAVTLVVTAVAGIPAVGIMVAFVLSPSLLLRTRVKLSDAGLEVRLSPFFHRYVPATDVTGLRLTRVSPLRDFGGWGIRKRRNATGLLLGPDVLEIVIRGGERLVVSVTDEERALAVLDTAKPPDSR